MELEEIVENLMETVDLAKPVSRCICSGLIRQQLVNRSCEPDGFHGQLGSLQKRPGAAGITFLEDQVEHLQH
jgi:hypothetical protein